VDHGQQMEALRLETPERLGGERMHRVNTAVANLLRATDDVVAAAERELVSNSVAAEADRILRNANMLKAAENIVEAEQRRIEDARDDREIINDIEQAKSAVNAAFEGNPLIQG
jgi:hypothetical protein